MKPNSIVGGNVKMVQLLWKTVWQFLKMLNIKLPYNPAIPLPGIYPREVETYVYTKICTGMFVTALFLIAGMEETTHISNN